MAAGGSTAHIIQSLVANAVIASAKGVAAFFTGSGSMMAETLHSAADCGNQLLLLLGVKRSKKPPDETHPLGYGRALYFWSFMVALLLFLGGGGFSIYEGVHKTLHPEKIEKVWLGVAILGFSILIEGAATWSNIKEIDKRRGKKPFMRYLRDTKDSDLVVVFGENLAATIGLFLAMVALILAWLTGDARWDGVGSLCIGVVLVAVAVFLALEVKSLLVGEAADAEIEETARAVARDNDKLEELLKIITVQQGPGEVLGMFKVRFASNLTSDEICDAINEFEAALRARHPELKWLFIEPDLPRTGSKRPAATAAAR